MSSIPTVLISYVCLFCYLAKILLATDNLFRFHFRSVVTLSVVSSTRPHGAAATIPTSRSSNGTSMFSTSPSFSMSHSAII